jgi:hypothetical protein
MTTLSSSRITALALCALPCGFSLHAQEAPNSPLGSSKEHAIEVCEPAGERAYLARLVCPNSSHPTFDRIGSVGMRNDFPPDMSEDDKMNEMMAAMTGQKLEPGQSDRHMIDGYSVQCGTDDKTIYLDMYHCDTPAPRQAPDGFTIIN